MNLNNKKITIFYNSFTFVFLLAGILYLYLSDISMGFARDLVYREYFIKNEVSIHINKFLFSFIWLVPLSYIFFNSLKSKNYSFTIIINITTFIFIIIFSLFFYNEYIFVWALFSIFAILRIPFLFENFYSE